MSFSRRTMSVVVSAALAALACAPSASGAGDPPTPPPPTPHGRVAEEGPSAPRAPNGRSRVLDTLTGGTVTAPSQAAAPTNQRSVGTVVGVGGTDVLAESALKAVAYATDRESSRAAGPSRYETAVEVSRLGHPDGSDDVFIATGLDFPDALAAGAYAGALSGPVLLSPRDSIGVATLAEVARLAPKRIHVAGSAGAVSDAVIAQLRSRVPAATITRLGGADRFETATLLSKAFVGSTTMAVVATGSDFPDALSASPAAAISRGSLLLTRATSLPATTAAELGRLRPARTYVVGGTSVVSDAVLAAIRSATGGEALRIAGPDRYATSAAISNRFFTPTTPSLIVAKGQNFPDALAGGALAGARRSPLALNPDGPNPARTSLDAARRVSWWYPATGRVLRYDLIVHPDDDLAYRSIASPLDPRRYDVHILLTRGEGTSYCNGQPITHAWASVEFTPQPQPRPQAYTEACKSHRLQSWNAYLDKSGAGSVGAYTRMTSGPVDFLGRQVPVPTTVSEAGSVIPANYFDIAVGPDSARVVFDIGSLTTDEILWTLQTTRGLRSRFPTQAEGDVLGAGFVNTTNVGYPNTSEHTVLYDLLSTVDLGLPGSQMSSVGHQQPGRTFGASVADYCAMMCHPGLAAPYRTSAVGTFQWAFGWLSDGIWPVGELDVFAGFSRYQSFGKWF